MSQRDTHTVEACRANPSLPAFEVAPGVHRRVQYAGATPGVVKASAAALAEHLKTSPPTCW